MNNQNHGIDNSNNNTNNENNLLSQLNNNFQFPNEFTKPFDEDDTDSDMELDSDDYDNSEDLELIDNDDNDPIHVNEGNENQDLNNNNNTNTELKEKKAPNAFILFSQEKRSQLKKENPDLTMAMISQLLGKEWKELHPNEKRVYSEKALKIKEKK